MLVQQLEGLLNREAVHAERRSGKPDAPTAAGTFYEKHRQLVAERLEPLDVDLAPVFAGLDVRLAELAEATDADAVFALFERHAEFIEPLVDQLLATPEEPS